MTYVCFIIELILQIHFAKKNWSRFWNFARCNALVIFRQCHKDPFTSFNYLCAEVNFSFLASNPKVADRKWKSCSHYQVTRSLRFHNVFCNKMVIENTKTSSGSRLLNKVLGRAIENKLSRMTSITICSLCGDLRHRWMTRSRKFYNLHA